MKTLEILEANLSHIEPLTNLFDEYRVFYQMNTDKKGAKTFLTDRIKNNESIIFIVKINGKCIGFTQLFPTFSSVSMERSYILNDLYVDESFRKIGAASALLMHTQDWCKRNGHKGLALETANDNPAQHLYQKLGWEKDTECFHYFWKSK